jgi:hypothetical protein
MGTAILAKMKESLKPLVENEDALNLAKSLDGVPLDKAQDKIDKSGLSAETQQKAIAFVKQRKTIDDLSRDQASEQLKEGVTDSLFADPFNTEIPNELNSDDQIKMNNLKVSLQKKALRQDFPTNPVILHELAFLDSEALKKVDLLDPKYVNGLSDTDYKKWLYAQRDARLGKIGHQKVQTVDRFVTDFVRGQLERTPKTQADLQKSQSIRAQFESLLNEFPEGERHKIETLEKVSDYLTQEAYTKSIFYGERGWGTDKVWERVYEDEEITELEERPEGIPKTAKWVDKKLPDGKPYRGWEETNPNGVIVFYDLNGVKYHVNPRGTRAGK